LKLDSGDFFAGANVDASALDVPGGRSIAVVQFERLELYHRVPAQGYRGNGC
jgi:hypothetical protein